MLTRTSIMASILSGVLLAISFGMTPAMAQRYGHVQQAFDYQSEDALIEVRYIDYRDVPIERIHRKLARRGLFPISDYRVRGEVVILRAENDYGERFRVVADAYYGDIIKITRLRSNTIKRLEPWGLPGFYNNWGDVRPGYDLRRKRRHVSPPVLHRQPKLRKNKKLRDRKKRKATKARPNQKRKATKARSQQKRRAVKARTQQKRRAVKSRKNRHNPPYIGMSAQEYKELQLDGGK